MLYWQLEQGGNLTEKKAEAYDTNKFEFELGELPENWKENLERLEKEVRDSVVFTAEDLNLRINCIVR